METLFSADTDYLIFSVNKIRYGVPHNNVVSVIDMPATTLVPHMPGEMRGVIPFRGGSTPLIDLRLCFDATSRPKETADLIQTMAMRKQDHINWLNKLKDEIMGGQPITVQTDPHKCAFGKWYDTFHTDNHNLEAYMKRFDAPHKQVHRVAVDAQHLIDAGKIQEAHRLVQALEKGVMASLLEMFNGIERVVGQYLLEYAIVFDVAGELLAVAVDDINLFCKLHSIQHPLPHGVSSQNNELVQAIGRYRQETGHEEMDVLLLNIQHLIAGGNANKTLMASRR